MANKDAAFGFKPTRHLTGGKIRAEEYTIAANHGTSIFNGQVVEAVAGGGIEQAAAGDTQQLGVFGGCFFTDPTRTNFDLLIFSIFPFFDGQSVVRRQLVLVRKKRKVSQ